MARPPRIPVMLPWERKVIYFITICIAPRCNAFANGAAWQSVCEKWRWQPGGFDRLLRTSESIHEKWNYIRENPVRAGLSTHWKQWPYQEGFADDE
jgi:hypothetical protein